MVGRLEWQAGGWGRSEEAAREVTIKIRRRSCFVAVVGAQGGRGGRGCDVRSTTGVKARREGEREKERDGRTAGRKGEDAGGGVEKGG